MPISLPFALVEVWVWSIPGGQRAQTLAAVEAQGRVDNSDRIG
jgi:hypothetical protein